LIGCSVTLHEIKAEPNLEIYMSASPLLDLFQKNLETSFFFGLTMFMATAPNSTVGNKDVLLNFGGGFGENSAKKVCLRVISSYVQVLKNPYPQDVS